MKQMNRFLLWVDWRLDSSNWHDIYSALGVMELSLRLPCGVYNSVEDEYFVSREAKSKQKEKKQPLGCTLPAFVKTGSQTFGVEDRDFTFTTPPHCYHATKQKASSNSIGMCLFLVFTSRLLLVSRRTSWGRTSHGLQSRSVKVSSPKKKTENRHQRTVASHSNV